MGSGGLVDQEFFFRMSKFTLGWLAVGVAIRVILFPYVSSSYLGARMEFSSPLTSFRRVLEAAHLSNPYSGDFMHMPPLLSGFFMAIANTPFTYFSVLVLLDGISAILLASLFGPAIATIFWLSPYTVVSALALSAESVHVLVVALLLFGAVKKIDFQLSIFLTALLVVLKPVSPIFLVFPLAALFNKPLSLVALITCAWLAVLHAVCFWISGGDPSYVYSSVISPLFITTDLEPNFGVCWCLFTVMFPGSVPLFRIVMNGHLLLLGMPVYIRLTQTKKIPYMREARVQFLILMMAAVLLFQPYPTALDFAFLLSLLLANTVFVDKTVMVCAQLGFAAQFFASVTATLWLERNTGNANFLFHMSMLVVIAFGLALAQSFRLLRLLGYEAGVQAVGTVGKVSD